MDSGPVFEPAANFGPTFAAVVVYGLGTAIPLGVILFSAVSAWWFGRLGARIRAARVPDAELGEGPAELVGRVELAMGASTAVRIEFKDLPAPSPSGEPFSETADVNPFYLRRATGERIRVEPGEKVELDGFVQWEPGLRYVKEVPAGEKVIARGVLRRDVDPEARGEGYRGPPVGWVMRPLPETPMSISRIAPHRPYFDLQRFYRRSTLVLPFAFAVMWMVLAPHYGRMLMGESVMLTVTAKRPYIFEDSDGVKSEQYELTSETPWGSSIVDDLHRFDWDKLEIGSQVPAIHAGHRFVQYGTRPSMHIGIGLFVFVYVVIVVTVWGAMVSMDGCAPKGRHEPVAGWMADD